MKDDDNDGQFSQSGSGEGAAELEGWLIDDGILANATDAIEQTEKGNGNGLFLRSESQGDLLEFEDAQEMFNEVEERSTTLFFAPMPPAAPPIIPRKQPSSSSPEPAAIFLRSEPSDEWIIA